MSSSRKKWVAVLVAAVLCFSLFTSLYSSATSPIKPTISVAVKILREIAGIAELTPQEKIDYDVNLDGKINIADAVMVLKALAGLIDLPSRPDESVPFSSNPDPTSSEEESDAVPVESVTLNESELVLAEASTATLTAEVLPANATAKTLTWSSTSQNIATVDINGKITTVKAGKTTIKATAKSGVEASCEVTVYKPDKYDLQKMQLNYKVNTNSGKPGGSEKLQEYVKVTGRAIEKYSYLFAVNAGPIIEFTTTGSSMKIGFEGHSNSKACRYAILVDGVKKEDRVIPNGTDAEIRNIILGPPGEEKTVRVIKGTEGSEAVMGIGWIGINGTEEHIQPAPEKKYLFEFVGDSITAGYGVDWTFGTDPIAITEDMTKTYNHQVSLDFDADYQTVARSGATVIAPEGRGPEGIIPIIYQKTGNDHWWGNFAWSKNWDFENNRHPDMVLINLGTNDGGLFGGDVTRDFYKSEYIKFIKYIREKHPDATIICAFGMMGDGLYSAVQELVAEYKNELKNDPEKEEDNNVYPLLIKPKTGDGAGIHNHPSAAGFRTAADTITAFLQTIGFELP